MSEPDVLHLTAAAAAARIARELEQASQALPLDLEAAMDGYIRALGLALALPSERRRELLVQARAQAALLDDVTEGRWQLVDWIDGLPTHSGA